MTGIVSRDAISTWFLDPGKGGPYLQPRRDGASQKTIKSSSGCLAPKIEYVGVLLDIPARLAVPVPQVRVAGQGLFLVSVSGLSAFLDTPLPDRLNVSQLPRLIVPLPLTGDQVRGASTVTITGANKERELQSEDPNPLNIPPGLAQSLSSARVIHVVIDDTIMPIHHHTRLADGKTRFAAIWHQDGNPTENQKLRFGRVWYRNEIDEILESDPATIRREFGHDVRRKTGMPTGAIAMSHGGAVLDLFSGYNPRDDRFEESGAEARDHPIIGVQLPAQVFWDSAGLALGFFISTALDFIVKAAAAMGGPKVPMVINLSYGMTAGPHDGTSFIERVIDKQLAKRRIDAPTELVLPIGNDYLERRSWRQTGNAAFEIEVPPHRARPIIAETWFTWPEPILTDPRMLEVSLLDPDRGTVLSAKMAPGEVQEITHRGIAVGQIAYENNPTDTAPGNRERLSLVLAPTHHPDPHCPVVRPGLWTLEITPSRSDFAFQSWIQRDDDPVGFPARTPPVRFRYPDSATEMAQRRFTASAKVTGKRSIIAAGWRLSDGRIAPYSASYDPAENPARRDTPATAEPQYVFAAPSESSAALPGLRAAGNVGGRGGALAGTSAAAPVLARRLADMLAAKPALALPGTVVAAELVSIVKLGKPGILVKAPDELAAGNPACLPGHVSQQSWLGTDYGDATSTAWTGEPAEYSQSRIGQGFCAPRDKALTRIRRK